MRLGRVAAMCLTILARVYLLFERHAEWQTAGLLAIEGATIRW
jgi:hypothetical protein